MSAADREKWDRRWRQRGAPGAPSSFLVAQELPRAGRALDVAGGAGRNALWLARRGLEVTLADISEEALSLAREAAGDLPVTTIALDLDDHTLPAGPFELIVCDHFLDRAVWRGLPERLASGGLLIIVQPTVTNLERHASPARPHLLERGELATLFPELETVVCEELWADDGHHEARLCARSPRP